MKRFDTYLEIEDNGSFQVVKHESEEGDYIEMLYDATLNNGEYESNTWFTLSCEENNMDIDELESGFELKANLPVAITFDYSRAFFTTYVVAVAIWYKENIYIISAERCIGSQEGIMDEFGQHLDELLASMKFEGTELNVEKLSDGRISDLFEEAKSEFGF